VKEWQEMTRERASKEGHVRTIMGRYRQLPAALNKYEPRAHSHALRAAINTPIQGSAADVVMMAMIKIQRSQKLKDLNWKLLLQIHDEVILEGPVESKDEVGFISGANVHVVLIAGIIHCP
jgi:DNA polymerase-1